MNVRIIYNKLIIDDSDNYSINSKSNPNSLISISKEVHHYLKEMVESKGSSVTEYILSQLRKSQTNLSFKNIQRRVYDAINVMSAVGILKKDKNDLIFKGIRGFISIPSKSKRKRVNTLKDLKEMVKQKKSLINTKQHELVGMCTKVIVNYIIIFIQINILFSITYLNAWLT